MIKQYFVNKCYNSLIGDTAPLAAANALAINIVILDSITPHILCHASVDHRFTLPSSRTVYVYLHSEHCSCISIMCSRSSLSLMNCPHLMRHNPLQCYLTLAQSFLITQQGHFQQAIQRQKLGLITSTRASTQFYIGSVRSSPG